MRIPDGIDANAATGRARVDELSLADEDTDVPDAGAGRLEEDEIASLKLRGLPDPLVAVTATHVELIDRPAREPGAVVGEHPAGETGAIEPRAWAAPAVAVASTSHSSCPLFDVGAFLLPLVMEVRTCIGNRYRQHPRNEAES